MDEITAVFVTESREQLAALEAALLELENQPGDDDTLNAIFRSAHTIKGGAGVIECALHLRQHATPDRRLANHAGATVGFGLLRLELGLHEDHQFTVRLIETQRFAQDFS